MIAPGDDSKVFVYTIVKAECTETDLLPAGDDRRAAWLHQEADFLIGLLVDHQGSRASLIIHQTRPSQLVGGNAVQ